MKQELKHYNITSVLILEVGLDTHTYLSLDYVDYIWTNYTYNTRSSSYSISPNTTVTYDSSYAGKKELLLFCGNT